VQSSMFPIPRVDNADMMPTPNFPAASNALPINR
jgi:hypothetical protein